MQENETLQSPQSRPLSFMDYRLALDAIVKAAKKMFFIPLVLMVLGAALLCGYRWYKYSPRYIATATFTVAIQNDLGASTQYYSSATAKQLALTFPSILNSGLLNNTLMKELGVSALNASISASAVGETNLFSMSVTASNAQYAYDVLQSVIKNYPEIAEYVVGNTKLTLIDESGVPKAPINKVNYVKNAQKGALFGLAAGVVIIVAYALTRQTIRTPDELKSYTSVPFIGIVPNVRFKKRKKKPGPISIMNPIVPRSFTNAIRVLRTRIERAAKAEGYKKILISSAVSGEGKTTVSVNLAMAFAKHSKKVVLMGCDLRNPSVAKRLGVENGVGITEYLSGKATLDEICTEQSENLTLILGGAPIQNASEAIASKRMRALIDTMSERCDYLILDTPPASLLTDASEIARYADAAVFIVRQDYARRSHILEGLDYLSQSRIPFIGCIMNGVEGGISSHDYGYGYGKYGGYYGNSK